MGGLHKGHGALIQNGLKLSKKGNEVILLSIYVNPLQFSQGEDLEKYPRDLKKDCDIAEKYGVNALWAPSTKDIFTEDINNHFQLKAPTKLIKTLCGPNRLEHFDGVATIVYHLLKLVKPKYLILGEKDWQQLIIIKNLIKEFELPIIVRSVKTIREENGLPASTRNKYLSQKDIEIARNLPKELFKAKNNYLAGKEVDIKEIRQSLEKKDLNIEYIELVKHLSLSILDEVEHQCLLGVAIKVGNKRLIDHMFLTKRKPVVAIDGPAGAGKSTVTKNVAEKLNLIYLDTGAMYRAVTWLIQKEEININDNFKMKDLLENLNLELKPDNNKEQKVIINGFDVTKIIRSPDVTSFVSIIAAIDLVREYLTKQQKSIGLNGGLIAEGRDIGTKVFPDADLKIYLTASPHERALRRINDLKTSGFKSQNIAKVKEEIMLRDKKDATRNISPLKKASDAIEVNTDGMSIDSVVLKICDLFHERIPDEVWPRSIR
tara:strand:- start:1465 stop:2931 length:1467 start_codon:yes stop_codon:yes gene_type:complete